MDDQMKQTYLHWEDKRTENQIFLSNQLVRSISEINIKRIKDKKAESIDYNELKNYYKNYLFVCIHGLPIIPNQFDFLDLPGTIKYYVFQVFEPNISEQERKIRAKISSLQNEAASLHNTIQNISSTKPLIFVYHSFGTNILSVYLQKYPPLNRLKGLVDIGGIPITAYPFIKNSLISFLNFSEDQLQNDSYSIGQRLNQGLASMKMKTYQSHYMGQALIRITRSQLIKNIFKYHRELPNVLKCIIFGRKDELLTQVALNEKAIHYCYKRTAQPHQQLKQNYKRIFGVETKNVQEKFIFSLQGSRHSFHYNNKRHSEVKDIVWSYLAVLCCK